MLRPSDLTAQWYFLLVLRGADRWMWCLCKIMYKTSAANKAEFHLTHVEMWWCILRNLHAWVHVKAGMQQQESGWCQTFQFRRAEHLTYTRGQTSWCFTSTEHTARCGRINCGVCTQRNCFQHDMLLLRDWNRDKYNRDYGCWSLPLRKKLREMHLHLEMWIETL